MSYQNQLRFLETSLAEKQDIINELRNFNDELCIGYENCEKKNFYLNEQMQDLQFVIQEKDDLNKKLTNKIQYMQNEILAYQDDIKDIQNLCNSYEDKLKIQNQYIEEQETEHQSQQIQLQNLINKQELEFKNLVHTLHKQQQTINMLKTDKEQFDNILESKFLELQRQKDEEITLKLASLQSRDHQRVQQLQDKLELLKHQSHIMSSSQPYLLKPDQSLREAEKFSNSVRNMVQSCVQNKELSELKIVWRVLKSLLTEYGQLKKEKLNQTQQNPQEQ